MSVFHADIGLNCEMSKIECVFIKLNLARKYDFLIPRSLNANSKKAKKSFDFYNYEQK